MSRRLLAALATAWLGFAGSAAADTRFSADEVARILRHGPWPPPISADVSNRASGRPDAAALGEALFFDLRLSGTGGVSCASCHRPDRGWSDGRATAAGIASVDRNTPGLIDVRFNRWFGWDGASDSLWASTIRPLLDAREMGSSASRVAGVLRSDRRLACGYDRVFGRSAAEVDDETAMVDVAKAIAAFQETLVSERTEFDRFRDLLAAGMDDESYPPAARRGLKIFVGKGDCTLCHFGPRFSNGEFADTAIPYFIAPGRVDAGRHAGIRALKVSPYSLLGRFTDATDPRHALATRHVVVQHRNWGEFKIPTLRNLAATAPYMHNGSFAGLRDVVAHYSEVDIDRLHSDGERLVRPLRLDDGEVDDLVAFLRTLSATAGAAHRDPVPSISGCQ